MVCSKSFTDRFLKSFRRDKLDAKVRHVFASSIPSDIYIIGKLIHRSSHVNYSTSLGFSS